MQCWFREHLPQVPRSVYSVMQHASAAAALRCSVECH